MSTIAYEFEVSFAGVQLLARGIRSSLSRRLDELRPERGDGSVFEDRGKVARKDSLDVIVPGNAEQVRDGLRTLQAVADSGDIRTFSHPIDGTWQARLDQFDVDISPGSVSAAMVLAQISEFSESAGNVTNPAEETTSHDVAVDAVAADNALALAFLDSPGVELLAAPTASWTVDTPATERQTFIEQFRVDMGATRAAVVSRPSTVANNSAALAVQRSLASVQRFSDTLSAGGWRYAAVTVTGSTSLANLLAVIYGASAVSDIIGQVSAENAVRDGNRLRKGTVLQVPTLASLQL